MQKTGQVTNYVMHFQPYILFQVVMCTVGKVTLLNRFMDNIEFGRLVKTLLYSDHPRSFQQVAMERKHQIKEVYRRNTIYKNSYFKSLILLFIWLIAFFSARNYFFVKINWHSGFNFFIKNFQALYRESFVPTSSETLKTGQNLTEQCYYSLFKNIQQIILKFQQLFAKSLALNIFKTKTIFENPEDEISPKNPLASNGQCWHNHSQ